MNRYAHKDGSRRKNPRRSRYRAEAFARFFEKQAEMQAMTMIALHRLALPCEPVPAIEPICEPRLH